VQRCAAPDEPDLEIGQPEPARQPRGERADPLGVLGRVVVAVLRRERQPSQGIGPQRIEIAVAGEGLGGHDRLEVAHARAQGPMLDQQPQALGSAIVERAEVGERDDRRRLVERERIEPRPQRAGTFERDDRVRRLRHRARHGRVVVGGQCYRWAARGRKLRAQRSGGGALGANHDQHAGSGERLVRHTMIMMDTSADPRIGQVIAGYRIESRIGRGGMGVVYRAEHLNLRRSAAIKIIAPEYTEAKGFRERFEREARISAALQHPNVVTVYDAGEVDGLLYLAMQYIEGSDLAAVLSEQGRLRPYRAIDTCRQVAAALDAAHALGLIHRDVKPANVLVEGRRAYLTDFGLTKRLEGTRTAITRAGDVVGTIHYVAPEQIEGRPVDSRADLYSLGCLLYHCLVGEVPYPRESDVAVIYAHLSEEPPKPSALRPDLPEGLDAVIAKALEKSPDRRFATCGDLMAAARGVIDAAGPLSETRGGRTTVTAREDSDQQAAMGAAIESAAGAAAADRRPRVLLAGADANTRALARVALGNRIEVEEAPRADEMLGAARDLRPDLVIVDWDAPGAPDAVGALRADAVTRDAKLLLLVDHRRVGSRAVAAAGADERLASPFSPLQLQVKLRKLLGAEAVSGG
jgi:serine/threonine-protein kinase